jgi:hypothetical protein
MDTETAFATKQTCNAAKAELLAIQGKTVMDECLIGHHSTAGK